MENYKSERVHDVNTEFQKEGDDNVVCDESIAAAADHFPLEEDDDFEDALDSLTLDSCRVEDVVGCSYEADNEADPSIAMPGCNEAASDSRHSSLCDDEYVMSEKQSADDASIVDDEALRQQEACLTDEQKQSRKEEAVHLKELGNKNFNSGCFEAAVALYTDALAKCLLCHSVDRAIIYSNRAAAKTQLEQYDEAIIDCTKALEFNADYLKALLRRAQLYEKTDKLDEALEDYTKALERDSSLHVARAACMRLPDQIKERNEKLKEEMIGKLKDLGNMILRPFGLSTNNFKLQQDPVTGSYSVNFQQDAQPPS